MSDPTLQQTSDPGPANSVYRAGAASGAGLIDPANRDEPANAGEEEEEIEIWTGSIKDGALQLGKYAVACKNGTASESELKNRRKTVLSFLSHLEMYLYSPEAPAWFIAAPIPIGIKARVNDLLDTYNEANWGIGEEEGSGGPDNANGGDGGAGSGNSPQGGGPADTTPTDTTIARRGASATTAAGASRGVSSARPPPANHPIWGVNGIMHGFVRVKPPQRDWSIRFNPAFQHLKRSAKVFGHNGLTPGDWWPSRMVAVFHGAHSQNVRGISGTAAQGAWSIVCSGRSVYSDLDRDDGHTLYYSADGSDKNTLRDRVAFESESTKALLKSIETKRPVRVLRSAGKENRHCPSVGVRYDGLYIVVKKHDRMNDKRGMYYSFELRRVANQPGLPLEQIERQVPSRTQIQQESRIKDWY
ncbi:PUA-like domain-containing protein [Cladorrhinum sp. PSN332]|nr:PUA-like domain-containing protein [Cladorrhinum sp. PSN332]